MSARIETIFPDINQWAIGNTRFAHVWTYASDAPGPHVCVNALVHGNEVCGAIAADWLLRELAAGLRPLRGALSVAFANVDAYQSFDANKPFDSRCVEEDFNRLWDEATLDGSRENCVRSTTPSTTYSTCIRCSNPRRQSRWRATRRRD
jgi:predicted deacylase